MHMCVYVCVCQEAKQNKIIHDYIAAYSVGMLHIKISYTDMTVNEFSTMRKQVRGVKWSFDHFRHQQSACIEILQSKCAPFSR